jgi:hypothetical protein
MSCVCAVCVQDLVKMCNSTGVKCELPVKGPFHPHDTIETRIRKAADHAKDTFGSP